jgi:hypothetical protein
MGSALLPRDPDQRHGRGDHRHHHADPAIARLCDARGPAGADRPLCLDPAAGRLCRVRHQPHARRRSRSGRLADDRIGHRRNRRAGHARLSRGRHAARIPVGRDADRHGPLPARLRRELSQPPGHLRLHHGFWPADCGRPGQIHSRRRCRGPYAAADRHGYCRQRSLDQHFDACCRRFGTGFPLLRTAAPEACPRRTRPVAALRRHRHQGWAGRGGRSDDPCRHSTRPRRQGRCPRRRHSARPARASPAGLRFRTDPHAGFARAFDLADRFRGVRLGRADARRQAPPADRAGPGTDWARRSQHRLGDLIGLSRHRRLCPLGRQFRRRGRDACGRHLYRHRHRTRHAVPDPAS